MVRTFALIGMLCSLNIAWADDLFEGAPEAPQGFSAFEEAEKALETGQVEHMNPQPPVPESVLFYDEIQYAEPEGVPLTLDLYVPKNAKTPPPVVLLIHGGAWRAGKKEDEAYYAVPLAAAGYATATIQYRLLPEHHFPKAIQDVNAAIHWLRINDARYGFDGNRMATFGGSAGGHLAMLAAYAQDPALGTPEDPDGVKDRIDAVVNIYGVADCTTPVAQASSRVRDFMGAVYAESVDMHALASPIFHLDEYDPPTITMHGTIDELVPINQADRLNERLGSLGIPAYYDRVDGWHHSMDLAQAVHERCLYLTKRFLERHLPIDEGFESIFNGESLVGWEAQNMSYWSVEAGAITGESTEDNPCTTNQFLVWQGGDVGDFELKAKFRLRDNEGNSGIQFRSVISPEGQGVGYQADILPSGGWLGGLCDEYAGRDTLLAPNGHKTVIDAQGNRTTTQIGEPVALTPPGHWNDYHIVARGNHVVLRVNGAVSAEVIDDETAHFKTDGILALQLRSGPPMKVQFKDIYLKRLP